MKAFLTILACAFASTLFSQSNIQQSLSVNGTGAAADPSAQLDVSANNKGMLVPRMTTADRTTIAAPAIGLLVFDTTSGGFWFYNGTQWSELGKSYVAGAGIFIGGNTVINTGDTNATDDLTTGSAAGGDLSGTFSNLQIATGAVGTAELASGSVTSVKISSGAVTNGQVLTADGAGAAAWVSPAGGGGIPAKIQDADTNTKIQVEESPNEDVIRFDLGGTERMVLRKNASGTTILEVIDPNSNTFVGEAVGNANTTGAGNTAYGASALSFNTTGQSNTATGSAALNSNTTGSWNTATGLQALGNNTTGDYNTATGYSALAMNNEGQNNRV